MTTMAYDSYSPTLVRPPKRTPLPDEGLIAGQDPAAGAGTFGALPAPTIQDPSIGMLPFGNGISPTMYAPTSGPVLDPMVPTGAEPTGGLEDTTIAPEGPTTFAAGSEIVGSPTGGAPILGSPTGGAAVLPGDDPRLAGARAMLDRSTGDLANTDRRSMLSSLLSDFDTQSAERDDNAFTQVGRRDAALGRLGSGMTSGALGGIARQSARDKQQFRNQLAQQTIGDEIGDRFNKAGLFRGLAGDEYEYGRGDRNERRGERGYQDDRGDRYRDEARGERGYSDDRGDRYRDESRGERSWRYGVGRDNYNNAQDYRNEMRGERGYQNDREAYNTDRGVEGAKLSDYLTGSAFDRAQQRYAAGKVGSPYAGSNYAGAAADAQGQSDATMQSLMMFLQSLGLGSNTR